MHKASALEKREMSASNMICYLQLASAGSARLLQSWH